MRGRKALPPALKLLTGNSTKRGIARDLREAVKESLSAPRSTIGPPPKGMDPASRAIWKRVAADATWLDGSNRELLTCYCKASAALLTDHKGFRVNATIVRACASELGLSATARAKLGVLSSRDKSASDLPAELAHAATKPAGA